MIKKLLSKTGQKSRFYIVLKTGHVYDIAAPEIDSGEAPVD